MTTWADLRGPDERRPPAAAFPLPGYRHARAALGDSPEIQAIATALENAATADPRAGVLISGTAVRVLRAKRYGPYPPTRLYYCVAETVVHLLWIEHFDEMEP
jgi:hypothetical protein